MTPLSLNEVENDRLKTIFSDLKILFDKDEILAKDVDVVINELSSEETRSFIQNLSSGTKPETALRESFFAGQSLLSKYFASEMIPEVNTGDGFIDYKMQIGNRFILMELKPPFDPETKVGKAKRELVKIKQKKLDWTSHIEQIVKYIKKGGEYIVITNLKDWYFFDDSVNASNCKPFFQTNLENLQKEFKIVNNLYTLIERFKYQAIRETLDEHFFNDLKIWIDQLLKIEFEVEDNQKIELALGLINKFIFIQTLHDYNIIEFRWIQKRWNNTVDLWGTRISEILNQFFDDTIKWFFKSYDTELFTVNEYSFVKKDPENIKNFYDVFKRILGIKYLDSDLGSQRGIIQYNFKFIDEDIFGRAYETYLANIRHEDGIYYTPSYITKFISEKTVGDKIDFIVKQIDACLEKQDYENAEKFLKEFIKIRIIDPACGSGSFLVKAFRVFWDRYKNLQMKIEVIIKEIDVYDSLSRTQEVERKSKQLQILKNTLGFNTNRELISKVLLRHIHGNDLDKRSIAIAKVNLWLEAIKQSPKDFVFENLPENTNRILPYLDMNIVNGDGVGGLTNQTVLDFLSSKCKNEIQDLNKFRNDYIEDSTQEGYISSIVNIKKKLKEMLISELKNFLKSKKININLLDSFNPIFWELDFWYCYFDDTKILKEDQQGFDCVIGNPPYERIQVINNKTSEHYGTFLSNSDYKAVTGNYDLAVIFIEKGYKLLKKFGEFGYIVTNKFVQGNYGIGLRKFLSSEGAIKETIDFGDQQVFKGATTYTTLLFLKKEKLNNFKYTLVKKLDESYEQLKDIEKNNDANNDHYSIFQVEEKNLSEKPWVFASSDEENILSKKDNTKKLSDISDIFVGLQTSADPIYIVEGTDNGNILEIVSKKSGKKYNVEKELFNPILNGKDIKRWKNLWRKTWLFFPYEFLPDKTQLIPEKIMEKKYPKTWQYLLDHKKFLDEREKGTWANRKNWHAYVYEKNLTMFSKPKIMTGVLANRSSFTVDYQGEFYFVGGGNAGGYGIAINDNKISMNYLVGLLNSSFFDWTVRKKTSKFHDGYFSYAKRFIDELPIIIPNEKNAQEIKIIEDSVKNIIVKTKEKDEFIFLWKKWSEQMKDVDRTLMSILQSEEENIKEGDAEHLWFEDTTFLISKDDEILKQEYENFEVRNGMEENELEIIGIKNSELIELFKIKCIDLKLSNHIYQCIRELLSSKSKVVTLEQLFEKTTIPVMQPNPNKKTQTIISKINDEYEKKFTKKTSGLLDLEDQIMKEEVLIDSTVFKIYGLDNAEIELILNSMGMSERYKGFIQHILK